MLLILLILFPALTAIFTFYLAEKYLKTPFFLNLIGTGLIVCNSFVLLGHYLGISKLPPEQLPNGLFYLSEVAILVYIQPSLLKLYRVIFERIFKKKISKNVPVIDDWKEYAWSGIAKAIIILLPAILMLSLFYCTPEIKKSAELGLEGIDGLINDCMYIITYLSLLILKGVSIVICLAALYVFIYVRPLSAFPKWLRSNHSE
jgi:hypothetical protein